jgi:hypothetical protein
VSNYVGSTLCPGNGHSGGARVALQQSSTLRLSSLIVSRFVCQAISGLLRFSVQDERQIQKGGQRTFRMMKSGHFNPMIFGHFNPCLTLCVHPGAMIHLNGENINSWPPPVDGARSGAAPSLCSGQALWRAILRQAQDGLVTNQRNVFRLQQRIPRFAQDYSLPS